MITTALLAGGGPAIPSFGTADSCVKHNGTFCTSWLTQNWSSVVQPKLIQHIELTVIAVAIGFVIAFGLALVAHQRSLVVAPITFVTSLLYTIPSLALFEILVPVTGLTTLTVEIALTSYTLLILFTNTVTGLNGVSPEVRDAAMGIGLTSRQALFRVELPLALPTIIAGLRVATVTIVSLLTVAAFIGPYGLGSLILVALNNSDFNTEFLVAGGLCIILGLVSDFLLVLAQRLLTPWAHSRRPV